MDTYLLLFHIFLCKAEIHSEMISLVKCTGCEICVKENCGMTIITEKILIDEEDLLW